MFYILSKVLNFALMPFNWVLLLMVASYWARERKRQRLYLGLAFVMLLLLSNNWLVKGAYDLWEYSPRNLNDLTRPYRVGIVLTGGMTSVPAFNTDHPGTGNHADRFVQAYWLYKAGKIQKILISGAGHPEFMKRGLDDGQIAQRLLIEWGVAKEDIWLESASRNTRENALFSAQYLKDKGIIASDCLLITSAFHLRRAEACFRKVDFPVGDTFPSDYFGSTFPTQLKDKIVPEAGTLGRSHKLWHEWIGYWVYRLMGYC